MLASDLIARLDDATAAAPEPPREYIGPSAIAHLCDMYLALSLRGFPDTRPSARLNRIFRDGHRLEVVVLADLVMGFLGSKWKVEHLHKNLPKLDWNGHFKGHMDGILTHPDLASIVLEIKSMNRALWTKFKNHGIQTSHPQYYLQVQSYMGLAKIDTAMLVAYNKDTSGYHAELIAFDEFEWHYALHRIETVMGGHASRVAKNNTDWRCRGCFKRESCWGEVAPDTKCASCANAEPIDNGEWFCRKHDSVATTPCDEWRPFDPGA